MDNFFFQKSRMGNKQKFKSPEVEGLSHIVDAISSWDNGLFSELSTNYNFKLGPNFKAVSASK